MGLSVHQENVLIVASTIGGVTARSLERSCGLSKSSVGKVLNALMRRGLLTVIEGHRVRFVATEKGRKQVA